MAITTVGAYVGSMAPDFTLAGSSGQISLSDYRGKHVVVYFMREFTCALSRKNVTQLKQLYSTLQARHTEVLVIAGGSRTEAEQLATTLQVPFPVLADANREVYRCYGLEKVLSLWQRSGTIVVDTQGRVSYLRPTTIPAGLDKAALMKALT
jgi:thioredoxin-dependent peroxiredoxin